MNSLSVDSASIEYDFVGDSDFTVSPPRNPIVLLPNGTAVVEIYADPECIFTSDLSQTSDVISEYDEYFVVEIINLSKTASLKGEVTGTIGCLDRPMTHISLDWSVVNHRLSSEPLEVTIPWDKPSTVQLFPDSTGYGPRTYTITVDGPASRVAVSETSGSYNPGDPIVLSIEPDGLLEPRMIARGEIVIVDSNNIEQRIPIVLSSQGDLAFGPLNWLAIPSNALATVLILLALSTATGRRMVDEDEESP